MAAYLCVNRKFSVRFTSAEDHTGVRSFPLPLFVLCKGSPDMEGGGVDLGSSSGIP